MKIKTILFVICFIGLSSIVSAQQYAIDKKATIISGSASFISQGGDLYADGDGNNATTFTFTPVVNHFVTKNLFVGGSMEFSTEGQGDYKSNGIGIGPQIGYAFGGPQNKAYPYIDLAILYYSMNESYGGSSNYHYGGSDIAFGFGVIVPVRDHIGLIFEGGYQLLNLKNKDSEDSYSGNIFSIGVGLAGLLFQDNK
jgi:hypothetical protein